MLNKIRGDKNLNLKCEIKREYEREKKVREEKKMIKK